ncbi:MULTISPECIES: hypothetical protein [Bacillus cereus group]|uniref:NADH dehydrogenase n=2 Tax=Bacillus cereus group TaxID=86661 RepID=A0AAW5L5R7_BACCE|nr:MULTISPECIES: hypothetical protein [Bacillus cereus group]MCQ6288983.1 hypothetical protein [Bacillus cereus]MCQ6318642.1 hypothetical protein [Bacillus cereus]MCQ6331335.1 hypothetical protein [Bacillus cereus]MCQ6386218.1 hypothetical protein [Bacillus cereus]PFT76580.1 hypothetical protein COK81_29360 [Bacillus thuringiensis]
MARTGKGDLADYGKSGQVKKKGVKLTVPAFEELADNETINKRQEIQELEGINEQQNKTVQETVHEQFLEQFLDNVTKEDTHTRQTWLIKNNTIKRLEKLSKGKKKGFKTELVNQALEMFLNRIEK